MPRRGHSLLESLVVLAIMATLASMLVPAIQKARAAANRTVCMNNLRQIGLAVHGYLDAQKQVPPARLCPAPWHNGTDLFCRDLPSPDTYTGPKEVWWAPYDNRPGTTIAHALPDYRPQGILLPWLDGTTKMFRCPDGIDTTPGSPTYGQTLQVSYYLDSRLGGRRSNDPRLRSARRIGGEHMGLPSCTNAAHWDPWPAGPEVAGQRHSPQWHPGGDNALYGDAHVSVLGN